MTPNQAPVEDHGPSRANAHPVVSTTDTNKVASAAASTTPSVETRSPTYTVQAGDILTKIGLDTGQSWHDIARWNNLADPNHLEVGQVLRVIAPAGEATGGTPAPAASGTAAASAPTFKPLPPLAASRPAEARPGAPTPLPPVAATNAVPLTGAATPQSAARDSDDDLTWAWPAAGPVVAPFDDVKTKGLAIGGKAGDPVYAAADGRVVYAGSGLRGYGNLVIVKHNANYLTAYAHNQSLLVKEDQIVKRGQKIAEMGATDTDRVQLHFEIRKQGKPIDPSRLLPAR